MKKTILAIGMAIIISTLGTFTAFAHGDDSSKDTDQVMTISSESGDEKSDDKSSDEKSDDKSSDEKSDDKSDEKSGDESITTVTVTAEDFDITTNDDNTVTFLYADGTAMANVTVTVKNTVSGADGDISRDEFATDENGVFDYSAFIDSDAYILRLTDPNSSNSLEYIIETGELSIEAGKNKSGDSGSNSKTNLYMIIGGAAAIVIIGVVAVIIVIKQKKKKAAFAAKAGKKVVKKKETK